MTDELKVFRGHDIPINSHLVIKQATLDDVCDRYGEQRYFGVLRTLCATPADRKVEIWDNLHVFWDEVDEFDLFISCFKSMGKEDIEIFMDGIDPKDFELAIDPNTGMRALRRSDNVIIDRSVHTLLTNELRKMHLLKKNVDVGYDRYTKEVMIDDDREEQQAQMRKPFRSILLPLISAMTNCADFKYRYDDVWTLPISVFFDALERVQNTRRVGFLMQGIYSGSVDMKKINSKELEWIGSLR